MWEKSVGVNNYSFPNGQETFWAVFALFCTRGLFSFLRGNLAALKHDVLAAIVLTISLLSKS